MWVSLMGRSSRNLDVTHHSPDCCSGALVLGARRPPTCPKRPSWPRGVLRSDERGWPKLERRDGRSEFVVLLQDRPSESRGKRHTNRGPHLLMRVEKAVRVGEGWEEAGAGVGPLDSRRAGVLRLAGPIARSCARCSLSFRELQQEEVHERSVL